MKKTAGESRQEVGLTKRYGQIGIAAVAAAARYHGKSDDPPAASGEGKRAADKGKVKKRSPPRRRRARNHDLARRSHFCWPSVRPLRLGEWRGPILIEGATQRVFESRWASISSSSR